MVDLAPLLAPLKIRGLALPNRVVMAPMTREFANQGEVGDDVTAYYRRRAEGGVGLLLTEGVGIPHPAAIDTAGVPNMHGQLALGAWSRVFESVHRANGRIIPQLWHQGAMRDAAISPAPDVPPLRASGIWGNDGGMVSLPRDKIERLLPPTQPASDAEIVEVIDAYAAAARNARAIGADGVAIHAGHGYLVDNFLWHGTNRRNDRWGGDHRARATFAAELVRAVRREVGEALPIFFRFSQFKMQDYKARLADTPQELEALLGPIADAGVDVFDGSQRYFDTPAFTGSSLNLAGWAKKLTGKHAMAVGGVGLDEGKTAHHIDSGSGSVNNLGRLAERMAAGEFDLVAVGRSLLNDPDWWRKAQAGEPFLPFDNANLTRLT